MPNCVATVDRCVHSQSRRTVPAQFQAASIRRRSAGRSHAMLPSKCCVFTRRGKRGRISEGRAHRHGRRGCAYRNLDSRSAAARQDPRWPPPRCRPCGVAGRNAARIGILGSQRAPLATVGRCATRARRQYQNVNGVAFSPDGQNVLSAGYDATLRIWAVIGGSGAYIRCRVRSTQWRSRRTVKSSRPAPMAKSISSPPRARSG